MKYLSLICILASLSHSCNYKNLDTEGFERLTAGSGVALVDVRTPEEYSAGHIPGASNCDWRSDGFLSKMEAAYPKEVPLAIYCRSGRRSADAAEVLSKAGYTVYNLLGGFLDWTEKGKPSTLYEVETFFTPGGKKVNITLIKHGSLEINFDGKSIQVDPVGGYGRATDYSAEFPKADVILITHEHPDHLDPDAIAALTREGEGRDRTHLILNGGSDRMLGEGPGRVVLANGQKTEAFGMVIEAVPAYNISEGHTQFHPKGNGNGYVITMDGFRIYIAGDTEDIPEMADLKDVDIAFLPVNQPYTMTLEQCVKAAEAIAPKVLIPYHFSQTDLSGLPERLPGMKVLLRQMQ